MVYVVGLVKPFKVGSMNISELFNEFVTLIVNYHLMMFTDFVPDVNTREYIGMSLVFVICGHLLINLFIIFIRTLAFVLYKGKLTYLKH